MSSAAFVYTDVAFAQARERHLRITAQVGLWIIVLNGMSWGAVGYWLGAMSMAVLDFLFAGFALVALIASRKASLGTVVHATLLLSMLFVWSFIVMVEGIPGRATPLMNHWWFLGIATAAVLLLFDSPVSRLAYASVAFVSFLACELRLFAIDAQQPFPALPENFYLLWSAGVHLSVFVSMLFLAGVFVSSIANAERQLSIANTTLESLLSNMLPKSIADRLRLEGKTFADGYAECSVLFIDLVGFTSLTDHMPAADLVRLLDEIFSKFDELTEQHGLEKIKTIGDAYMAAAGLPVPRADHAQSCVALATALRGCIREYAGLKARIGINSGSVIAGVIGKRRFIYDLWGDTVNIASRMESHGVSDEIQVSQRTAELIDKEYETVPRGNIEIKGKGSMPVFLVVGKRLGHTHS